MNYSAAGDIIKVTDPLGNATALTPDLVGRITKITDPLGFDALTEFNTVDQVSKLTDANQGVTQLGYDSKRNLTSVINPLNNTIESYTYDNRYRLTQIIDAKLKSTGYQYDGANNVSQVTDRKGQVTIFTRDLNNRITQINFLLQNFHQFKNSGGYMCRQLSSTWLIFIMEIILMK